MKKSNVSKSKASQALVIWQIALAVTIVLFVPGVIGWIVLCNATDHALFDDWFFPIGLASAFGAIGLWYISNVPKPKC